MPAIDFLSALTALRKDQPDVGDVHISSAGGDGASAAGVNVPRRRRARSFAQVRSVGGAVAKRYASVDQLPQAVKDKISDPTKRRQWLHVFNGEIDAHGDEARAFASAWSTVQKADGAWSLTLKVAKTDADQNLVFGWAQVIAEDGKDPADLDTQGDIVDEATLEKAFYGFAEDARLTGEMHEGEGLGKMVECMVFTKAKQKALGVDLRKVGAWVGFRVPPATFAKVKDGTYPAFSIQGFGRRVPI